MVTTNEGQPDWFTNDTLVGDQAAEMNLRRRFYNTGPILSVILLSLIAFNANASGEVITGTDETAQLPFWEWRDESVSVRLVQRLPDQSRAYFTARGFNREHAELIARSCVFQTIYKNVAKPGSDRLIEYDLSKWKIYSGGKELSLKLRDDWETQWSKLGVSQKAKIAFKWSLLPTRQSYKPQDYNWGMTVYGMKPGSRFDLQMLWTENGAEKKATLKNMECAPDVHLDPKDPFG